MDFEVLFGSGVVRLALSDGSWGAGGGPDDGLYLPGLPAGLLRICVQGARATLRPRVAVPVGATPLAAGVERLWLEGEVVTLGAEVRVRRCALGPRERAGTQAVLAAALRGEVQASRTRAPTLTCLTGTALGHTWALARPELSVGRSRSAEVRLPEHTVSRRHARLVRHRGHWLLLPERSRNGTHLNGRPVTGARALRSGDVLELGAALLRFDGPADADGAPAPDRTLRLPPHVGAPPPPPRPGAPSPRRAWQVPALVAFASAVCAALALVA